MTRDSDTVCFKERHIVPAEVVQEGLSRFNLMLDMNAPGTIPDPLLIAALIDLVILSISLSEIQLSNSSEIDFKSPKHLL